MEKSIRESIRPSSIFEVLAETQIEAMEETCERCKNISEECNCDEYEPEAIF
jgi:hypothetical protein